MNNKAEYTPEKVVDISNLSREDWLEYRKKGIGGSDVAAIMGISPFATIRDLFYNKTGVQPVIQEEEESNRQCGWCLHIPSVLLPEVPEPERQRFSR